MIKRLDSSKDPSAFFLYFRTHSYSNMGERFHSSIAGDCSLSWFDPVFIQVSLGIAHFLGLTLFSFKYRWICSSDNMYGSYRMENSLGQ